MDIANEKDFHNLAFNFVRGLSNEQRKQLHVLMNCVDGADALEDELPSGLHDQACAGDPEAFLILQWNEESVNSVLDRGGE